jgi:hypothetical protein
MDPEKVQNQKSEVIPCLSPPNKFFQKGQKKKKQKRGIGQAGDTYDFFLVCTHT